jgi:hypothetical protein
LAAPIVHDSLASSTTWYTCSPAIRQDLPGEFRHFAVRTSSRLIGCQAPPALALQPNHVNVDAEITRNLGVDLLLGGRQHNLGLQRNLLCRTVAANQLVQRLLLNLGQFNHWRFGARMSLTSFPLTRLMTQLYRCFL